MRIPTMTPFGMTGSLDEVEERPYLSTNSTITHHTIQTTTLLETTGITIKNIHWSSIDHFIFLGSRIDKMRGCFEEVRRTALGRDVIMKLDKIMKDKDKSFKTKKIIIETFVFPVVSYGCETLRKETKLIDLKPIYKRSNVYILNEVNPVRSLESQIYKQRLTYFGHILRANDL
ncbi:hypothetical protein LAZ67_13001890 [Cordylochernes scorpioides]|uniref:Uncharacterized protein n=1 Tax=Cordylochernes scorpioides TaxID=51811 RepID=A0ABY6L6W1_9ARAC|nr:hypothetical protein LAZ67_13001890 [Cordylochernes scorpioides]